MKPLHAAILIPARNEEELLPECLVSARHALQLLPAGVSGDLIVVVDSSTDRTLEIARHYVGQQGIVLQTDAGSVGKARALAAEMALARCTDPAELCWLANTDADCVLPPNWLVTQLTMAAQGWDVVAGSVDVIDYPGQTANVAHGFRATYKIAADGTHTHVHGANLGVRADVYLQAGGWSDHTTGEDHQLWKRLIAVNARRASVTRTQVITSGRRAGRAPNGFAEALAAHSEFVP